MRCLIFGGAGFLGEYLFNELNEFNYEVTIADIKSPRFGGDYKFINADILEVSDVEHSLNGEYDYVINLAGFANLDEASNSPIETLNLNVIGNSYILNQLIGKKIKRFVYASSAYAVSNQGSFYGISKLASEKVTEEFGRKFKIPFSIVRYGSVYAERDYENNYLYQLLKSSVTSGSIDHHGDGSEIREYIHAADASRLTREVMENNLFLNNHVILTGMERMKRSELFEMIKEILGDRIDITYQKEKSPNHYRITPYSFNPSLSKKLVSNPFIDIGQGIVACLEDIQNRKDNNGYT